MQLLPIKLLTLPTAAQLIFAASAGSLLFALIIQFGFGILPCELCLWQRVPFSLAAFLGLIAIWPFGRYARWLIGLCAVLFVANAGLAVFHSGVERHWWEFHSACTGSALSHTQSLEDLRQELLGKPVVRCDEISWSLFGLSMANFNIVFSAVLAGFSGMAARRK